ncbi:hypothetical protein F2P81_008259 [Scophthalmus maximus]|uniref:Uncharacterized protein n=1 Tax=Scophthalmus maximus TaxID=52904 RepID=A0A6A4TA40_SCOMX|nr:hypothetical protein F2P81_008259 [Scophthalmus maximus]
MLQMTDSSCTPLHQVSSLVTDDKVELNCTERGENPESLHEVLNPVRFSLQDASSLSHLLRCRKCIKDEEGAVLLVVKQQAAGAATAAAAGQRLVSETLA